MKAKLVNKQILIPMKTLLISKADTNDADYITEIQEIKSDEQRKEIEKLLEKIIPIISKSGHNWETGEMGDSASHFIETGQLTEDECEQFSMLLPDAEYGIHTVESIKILEVINEKIYV
jgi:hypothetical protein